MARKRIIVEHPSKEQVAYYLKAWDEQENYVLQERALDKLFFHTYPNNTDINDILIKASSLNDFYSTNIFSIFTVAKHILSLDIDKKLHEGDAAHAVMGGSWRMPTFAEVRELIDKCSWKWVDEINEQGKLVRGFEVTGSTQNSIFIPMGESNTDNHTDGAAYMSSTIEHKLLTDEDYSSVRGLYLMKNEVTVFWMMRFRGNQVRAVCK